MNEKNTPFAASATAGRVRYRLILWSLPVGLLAGLVTSLYRFALSHAEEFSARVYEWIRFRPVWILPALLILAGVGILVGVLAKSEPMIKGSGIPQVEGQVRGLFSVCWWKVLVKKFLGGVLAIGAGLSLGREGPSIQLGAETGEGVAVLFRRDEDTRRALLTCGAGAGLAAAFNAPLAGVIFVLEELRHSFSVEVMLSALIASAAADAVSKLFFGLGPVLSFGEISILPLSCCLPALLLGVLAGVSGWFYNKVLLAVQKGYRRLPFLKGVFVMVIPFLAAGAFGICAPELTGGGHRILELLARGDVLIGGLLLLLAGKFAFSMISFGSGAPGGIFFPLLVLGALIGGIFGRFAVACLGVPPQYIVNFYLLGMAGMFTGVVRAPITGIVLIMEMSEAPTQMLPLALTAAAAYLIAELLRSEPIYDSLLNNLKESTETAAKQPNHGISSEP